MTTARGLGAFTSGSQLALDIVSHSHAILAVPHGALLECEADHRARAAVELAIRTSRSKGQPRARSNAHRQRCLARPCHAR